MVDGLRAPLPLQPDGDRCLCVVPAGTGGVVTGLVVDCESPDAQAIPDGEGIGLWVGQALVTRFHSEGAAARPFCWPLYAPGGRAVTRSYPMRSDVAGETHDHPHHRSLWTAYGELNGSDNWSEEAGHGFQRVESGPAIESGPAFARIIAPVVWSTAADEPQLREERSITVYATDDPRLIDYEVTLHALTPVHFGDTKEGGLISLRVATPMDGSRGGTLQNGAGGVGEAAVWGKRAPWCDYCGTVENDVVGVAVLDHPANFRAPTYWHARDYGLMTANVFGGQTFTNDPTQNGAFTLGEGQSLRFRYRLVLHRGDAAGARIAELYATYAGE
jgi:hypothetical protein